MATSIKDGLNYIIQAIENIIEPKLEKLRYDKTYRAKVIEKTSNGVYKVQINGTEYSVKYKGDLNVGDIVKVKAPLNNFSDIYIETLPSDKVITSYNDLNNKPAINSTYTTAQTTSDNETIQGTISFHKISKTGSYNDLNNKPTIPSVVDNLTSTSTSNALSANQGRLLNNKFGNYLPLTGGTLTGNVHMQKSSSNEDTGYYAKRTDTGTEAWFGIGAGGVNHGIYSILQGRWILYADKTTVYVPVLTLLGNMNASSHRIAFGNGGNLYWKEGNYGDQFQIIPEFTGTDDSNKMRIRGAVGDLGTTPALYDLLTISGKSGNGWIKGSFQAPSGFISMASGHVGTPTGNSMLMVKRANNNEAPNNGVVLEYGTNTSYSGQLYFGDNAVQGVYYNGWSNGTRGSWRRLADQGVTLYNNTSGTAGTITLNQSAANFNYLEIFYFRDSNDHGSTTIANPNGKLADLKDVFVASQGTIMQIAVKRISISGTSITSTYEYYANLETNKVSIATQTTIRIVKVVGYRIG